MRFVVGRKQPLTVTKHVRNRMHSGQMGPKRTFLAFMQKHFAVVKLQNGETMVMAASSYTIILQRQERIVLTLICKKGKKKNRDVILFLMLVVNIKSPPKHIHRSLGCHYDAAVCARAQRD